ncbi:MULTISPECIES: spore coat U domain-containing protein [Bacteria]|uniref:Csu type fimbrial protein n=1 Tax=Bacteria TaxID=2 RepID=UPI0014042EE6|nr:MULTISPECIES: spore coat U domain-containing protein [Bacteria]
MRKIAFGIAAVAAVVSAPALAGTATGTVQVSLNVSSSCSVTAQPLDFGTTNSFATAIDSSSATTVKCTPLAPYSVFVSYGANANGTQRQLASTTDATKVVKYDVYSDASRSTAWTPTVGTTGVGDGNEKATTLYGRVPVQTAVAAGDYKDTVTVTVSY